MSGLGDDTRPAGDTAPAAAKPWYRLPGPGLLAGASDAGPGNVAVYAQAGSQFGFNMAWMIVVTLPMMVAVQLVRTRTRLRANRPARCAATGQPKAQCRPGPARYIGLPREAA